MGAVRRRLTGSAEPVPARPRPVRAAARGRAAADGRAGNGRRAGGARRRRVGGSADRRRARADRRRPRRHRDVEPCGPRQGSPRAQRRERAQRRHRHAHRAWWRSPGSPRTKESPASRARAELSSRCWSGCWPAPRSAGLGGAATRLARGRGWLSEELAGPAVLALALLAYTGALLVDGNGFVAAFVGGLVFGGVAGRGGEKEVYFVEQSGAVASMISWLIFGALAVPVIGDCVDSEGAGVRRPQPHRDPDAARGARPGRRRLRPVRVAFVGWFGPRGLASVIFALLAVEDLARRGQGPRRGHRLHRAAQRHRAWLQRRTARERFTASPAAPSPVS